LTLIKDWLKIIIFQRRLTYFMGEESMRGWLKHFTWEQKRKALYVILLVAYWSGGYFAINLLSQGREFSIMHSVVDRWIPFVPQWIYIYMAIYLVIFSPLLIVKDFTTFRRLVMAYVFVFSVSFLVFLIYPVKMIRPLIASQDFSARMVAVLYSVDKPYNCFPSIHVSAIFLAALVCLRVRWKTGIFILISSIMISVAALYTKQHYFVDILGGVVVALAGYDIFFVRSKRWQQKGVNN